MISSYNTILIESFFILTTSLYVSTNLSRRNYINDICQLTKMLKLIDVQKQITQIALLRTEPAKSLWRSILTVTNKVNDEHSPADQCESLLKLTSRILSNSKDVGNMANEMLNVFRQHTSNDVIALAIITKDSISNSPRIDASIGIPIDRVAEALLSCFDSISSSDSNLWGYYLPQKGDLLDLSHFDIGLSLNIPLQYKNFICGSLWLGIKYGAGQLNESQHNFIKLLTQHFAAALYAVQQSYQRASQIHKERDFLIGLSHDLRTPGVTAQYAINELLSEKNSLSEKQSELLSLMNDSLKDQMSMLSDILDITRFHRGLLHTSKNKIDVAHVVQQCVDGVTLQAQEKNISIVVNSLSKEKIEVDERHLKRILQNFLSNAVKYTGSGTVTIHTRVKEHYLELLVSDTGEGIPRGKRHLLFQEFTRITSDNNISGNGLGLALTEILAEANDGYVFYKPHTTNGSTFGVGFKKADVRYNNLPHENCDVVIIEDNKSLCNILNKFVCSLELSCNTAHSWLEARQLISIRQPSLIITDWHLNNQTADTLLIPFLRDQTKNAIIIAGEINSHKIKELKEKFPRIEVFDKPVDRASLCSVINSFLQVKLNEHLHDTSAYRSAV